MTAFQFAWPVVILAMALNQHEAYEGKDLAEWKSRTQSSFSLEQRKEAIGALSEIASQQMGPFTPSEKSAAAPWVQQEIVPTLGSLLLDTNPKIRAAAAYAFVRIGWAGRDCVPRLVDLLHDQDESVRGNAARAIGEMGSAAVPWIPKLVEMAHDDPSMRGCAADAIRTLGPHGQKWLASLLEDSDPEIRKAAVQDLDVWTKSTQAVLPSVVKLLRDNDDEIRAAAIQAVFNIHPLPVEAMPAVRELLRDNNPKIRKDIVGGLGHQTAANDLLPELSQLTKDRDVTVRIQLGYTAAHLGERAVPMLLELLDDADEQVRGSAAFATGQIGLAAGPCAEKLDNILRSDGAENRQYAANALAIIRGGSDESLAVLLADDRVEIRRAAVASIVWKKARAAAVLSQLIPLLTDNDRDVQRDAVQIVFNELKPLPNDALPFVPQLLNDGHPWIRSDVIYGVMRSQHAEVYLLEFKRLLDDPENRVRIAAARAVKSTMGTQSVPLIAKLLDDQDPKVRSAIADLLGEIGPPAKEAVPALVRLLNDKNYASEDRGLVCNCAGLALVQITGDKKYLNGLPPSLVQSK